MDIFYQSVGKDWIHAYVKNMTGYQKLMDDYKKGQHLKEGTETFATIAYMENSEQ